MSLLAMWSYLIDDLEKIGSACKLVKAGIFHRSHSNSSAHGLIADRCRLLTVKVGDKSFGESWGDFWRISLEINMNKFWMKSRWKFLFTKKLREKFLLKIKSWDMRLIQLSQFLPLLCSPITPLSDLQTNIGPPKSRCTRGFVFTDPLLQAEHIHNCTVSASHEQTGNIYAMRIKKVTLINGTEDENYLRWPSKRTFLHIGCNLCRTCCAKLEL